MTKLTKDTRDEIKMYQAQDYEICTKEGSETPAYLTMTRKNPQSIWVHILLFCITGGIGNVIYFLVKVLNPKKKKIMK